MWIFSLSLTVLLTLLIGRENSVRSAQVDDENDNCGHNFQSNCLIVATFGSSSLDDTIDVLVNCTGEAALYKYNQFSKIDVVKWNGCSAVRNLKFFGLRKIPSRKEVKELKIEKFVSASIEPGTFEGFGQLESLTISSNFIQSLAAACFRGLESLRTLQMTDNGLLSIDGDTMRPLSKLAALQITDSASLTLASHQFGTGQIVESVALAVYAIESELVEHLFNHARNLSISLAQRADVECEQTRFNGYEKEWRVQALRLENFRCGFVMEDLMSIEQLEVTRALTAPFFEGELRLRSLKNLRTLRLNHNDLREISSVLEGDFGALEALDASFNELTLVDMTTFEKFPQLERLNLTHNSIVKMPNLEKTHAHLQIAVDFNALDCTWLERAASFGAFGKFVYTPRTENLNINGLECALTPPSLLSLSTAAEHKSQQRPSEDAALIVRPRVLAFVMCGSLLLGIGVTYIAIYAYTRRRLLKHQPFYHMLRESLVRPFANARDTLATDFKGIIFRRNMPPTNYEHPISETTEMTDVIEEGNSNIYEEIPATREPI